MSPLHWFSLAQELGQRAALERACLRGALELLASRPHGTSLSVNLSAPVLLEAGDDGDAGSGRRRARRRPAGADRRDHRGDARPRRHAARRARSSRCARAARAWLSTTWAPATRACARSRPCTPATSSSTARSSAASTTTASARRSCGRSPATRSGRQPARRRGRRDRGTSWDDPPPRRAARAGLLPQPPRPAVAAGERPGRRVRRQRAADQRRRSGFGLGVAARAARRD